MLYNNDVMWIPCGQQHEATPKATQAAKSHGPFPDLGSPLGRCGGARGNRLELHQGPFKRGTEAMPSYADSWLSGPRRRKPHLPNVINRTPGMRTIGEDPNGLHQREEDPLGTLMTNTATGRGFRREPPQRLRWHLGNLSDSQLVTECHWE